MRLTLRTLLAYMDGILEPEDAEEIRKKIEASPVAADLLRRARDVTRRLRLKAPEVDERAGTLDPNTVAEYLDHMLPDDRVPDFERICLESDMQLAEVAACHQILALGLGEPAEIDPASRDHMYQLPQVLAEEAAMQTAEQEEAVETPEETPPVIVPRRPRPVVPDYLRDQQKPRGRRWIRAVVAVVLVLCLVVVGLGLSGQLDRWGFPLWRQLAGSPAKPEAGTSPGAEVGPVGSPSADSPGGLDVNVPLPPPGPVQPGIEPTATPPGQPPVLEPPSGAGITSSAPPPPIGTSVAPPSQGIPALPVPEAVGPPPSSVSPVPAGPVPAGPTVEPGSVAAAPGEATGGDVPGPQEPPPLDSPTVAAGEPAPAAPERIGLFVSDGEVLLESAAEDPTQWSRVPAQGILTSGKVLVALPTYRPLVALSNSTTIHLIGGAQVRLLSADVGGIPNVAIDFGRVVLRTVGKPEAQLLLDLAGRRGVVTLVDPESMLAIEVTRPFVAGADPELDPAPPTIEFWSVAGKVRWEETDAGGAQTLEPAAHWVVGGPPAAPGLAITPPDWIASDTTGTLDRRASTVLAQAIRPDRSAALSLQETMTHRKREVVWLAERSLGYLGDFPPLVKTLDDRERWQDWPEAIEQLRKAQSRGPVAARAVREAFERAYGPSGAQLSRMLCNYSNEQLAAGADNALVEALDHERLVFRLLASTDLKEITGSGLFYRPEDPPAKRMQPVRNWQKRRSAGEIRWPVAGGGGAVQPVPGEEPAASSPENPPGAAVPGTP